MAAVADLASAIDTFMAEEKTVVGADRPFFWSEGYSRHERVAKFPLEVNGEQPGAHLAVVAFPNAAVLKFRLSVCFNAAICRLDYTDEYHPNSLLIAADNLPSAVNGPHYHSWPVNRRFFRAATTAVELHNAMPFNTSARSFDSILRWFCEDNRINGLAPNHNIELPSRERLL